MKSEEQSQIEEERLRSIATEQAGSAIRAWSGIERIAQALGMDTLGGVEVDAVAERAETLRKTCEEARKAARHVDAEVTTIAAAYERLREEFDQVTLERDRCVAELEEERAELEAARASIRTHEEWIMSAQRGIDLRHTTGASFDDLKAADDETYNARNASIRARARYLAAYGTRAGVSCEAIAHAAKSAAFLDRLDARANAQEGSEG